MSKCIKCGNEILTGDIHWEMGLCNNCYNELYKDHKTHISLDKMWLEIAQSFRYENEKLQDKIADLEAKLAESEKRFQDHKQVDAKTIQDQSDLIEKLKSENQSLMSDNAYQEADIFELTQKLAEKEKEIEINKNALKKLIKNCGTVKCENKISFAIERLEKVKWFVDNLDMPGVESICNEYMCDIEDYIDNQIKQLKEGK